MGCREAGGFVIAILKMGEAVGRVRDKSCRECGVQPGLCLESSSPSFPTGFSRGGGVSGEGCPS